MSARSVARRLYDAPEPLPPVGGLAGVALHQRMGAPAGRGPLGRGLVVGNVFGRGVAERINADDPDLDAAPLAPCDSVDTRPEGARHGLAIGEIRKDRRWLREPAAGEGRLSSSTKKA